MPFMSGNILGIAKVRSVDLGNRELHTAPPGCTCYACRSQSWVRSCMHNIVTAAKSFPQFLYPSRYQTTFLCV